MGLFNFFSRGKSAKKGKSKDKNKPSAYVFVDFEHWYFGLSNYFHTTPDYQSFVNMLSEKYVLKDIFFFADFSLAGINSIVETKNGTTFYKKDFTDFIILDYIYQRALSSDDIDCFIILTGDGHFTSVANFLKTKCGKEVGICGVRGATSKHLVASSNWSVLFPTSDYDCQYYYGIILKNFDYLENKKEKSFPTFMKTVDIISTFYELDSKIVESSLSDLIEKKVIYYKTVKTDNGNLIKILQVNWRIAGEAGLWKR